MQDMYAEDAVWDISGVFTDVAPIQGHESLRRYWDEMWETWEGVRMDPLEVFDVGDGRYVVDVRLWGRASGAALKSTSASLTCTRFAPRTRRSSEPSYSQTCNQRSPLRSHPLPTFPRHRLLPRSPAGGTVPICGGQSVSLQRLLEEP